MARNSYTDWYRFLDKSDHFGKRVCLYHLKTGAKLYCEIAPEGSNNTSVVELDTFRRVFQEREEAEDFFTMVMQDLDSHKY